MAETKRRYPGWTPWAVAAAVAILFIVIAFVGGIGGRSKPGASQTTQALRLPATLLPGTLELPNGARAGRSVR